MLLSFWSTKPPHLAAYQSGVSSKVAAVVVPGVKILSDIRGRGNVVIPLGHRRRRDSLPEGVSR